MKVTKMLLFVSTVFVLLNLPSYVFRIMGYLMVIISFLCMPISTITSWTSVSLFFFHFPSIFCLLFFYFHNKFIHLHSNGSYIFLFPSIINDDGVFVFYYISFFYFLLHCSFQLSFRQSGQSWNSAVLLHWPVCCPAIFSDQFRNQFCSLLHERTKFSVSKNKREKCLCR